MSSNSPIFDGKCKCEPLGLLHAESGGGTTNSPELLEHSVKITVTSLTLHDYRHKLNSATAFKKRSSSNNNPRPSATG